MASDKQIYRYPYKAFTDTTDYLQIDVVEYKPIGGNLVDKEIQIDDPDFIGPVDGGGTPKKTIKFKGRENISLTSTPGSRRVNTGLKRLKTILLPIPSNVQDGNAVSYEDASLNSIAGAAVGTVTGVMGAGKALGIDVMGGVEALKDAVIKGGKIATEVSGGLDGVQGLATRYFASKAVNLFGANITPNQILQRESGEILNPNLELLFNAPTLRNFKFQFKMTPRSSEESREILEIIRCLKINMAPKTKGTQVQNTFLKTPNVFELRYRQGNNEHKFLHKFKQCFLTDISVNYTGEGTYATYDDGTPVSMIMDLTFKEIEPVYDIDYENVNAVGY